jgi:glyoxylase I family protein
MDLRAHHVGLVISDLASSLAFYKALGFEVESSLPTGDQARSITFLRLGDFRLELFWYAETPPVPAESGDKHIGFRHLALKTDDIDATVSELQRANLLASDAGIREVAGLYRLLFLNDPDGLEVEITQELS